jgi:uncharacterized protein YabE (DUF348 family)
LYVLAAIMAAAGLALVYWGTGRRVLVQVDGTPYPIHTHATSVGGALRGAGFYLAANDRVIPAVSETLSDGISLIQIRRAKPVTIQIGSSTRLVQTAARIPADILAQSGALLFPGDRLWADGLPVADPTRPLPGVPSRLTLDPGKTLSIQVGDHTQVLRSAAPSVAVSLLEAGVPLHQADILQASGGAGRPGVLVAVPITISVDGQQVHTWAAGPTTGEALAQAGVSLVGLDSSLPAPEAPLPADGHIRVVRVRDEILVEQKPLLFQTTFQPSADLDLDSQRVLDPGAYGMQARRIRVRLQDGEEVSRVVEGEWTAIEPKPRVVGYGTRVVLHSLSTADGAIQYWRAVTVYATSYSPCRSGSDHCLYYTSSRKPVQKGVIGVTLTWYHWMQGEPVYVPGYGFATIEDVGGGIPGRRWIDLGYSDDDWVAWGSSVTLYFLAPVPPSILNPLP